eukprot:TRINITY_DN1134_c0_g1_i4.p1 TRINITY_DN1134_c0_g1~~TRINITY_DN1134_c0_g1_i4.p1  ORF type:complete len:344 (+),score=82.18 TRINITY_DN1134_c0_g1_i4:111-1142(+)
MQSVHCKVSLDDQIRRFQFTSSSGGVESNFSILQTRIRTLFGIVGEFTLRFKDNEGDLVLVESDDELKYAFAESAGLLRIFVELKNQPSNVSTTSTIDRSSLDDPSSTSLNHDKCGHGKHGRGRGGGRGGRGRCGKTKIERLTFKREYILSLLTTPEVTEDEMKKQRLQRKLESIETRLATLNSKSEQQPTTVTTTTPTVTSTATASDTSKVDDDDDDEETESSSLEQKPDTKNKKENRIRKCRHHREPKVRRTLSPEDKNMLVVLKAQIKELKPSFNDVKIQLTVKKAEKEEAQEKGDIERVEQLKKEIQQLKEIQAEQRKTIAPLKDQIYSLKFESKREQN